VYFVGLVGRIDRRERLAVRANRGGSSFGHRRGYWAFAESASMAPKRSRHALPTRRPARIGAPRVVSRRKPLVPPFRRPSLSPLARSVRLVARSVRLDAIGAPGSAG